jgi:hypothetical protein
VRVAEGTVVESHKQGDLILQSNCGAQLRLTGVLVIPSFTKNIISGSKLVQNNSQEIEISANGIEIIHDENILPMLFNPSIQLWYMNGTRIPYMDNNNTINTLSKIYVTPYNTKQNVVSVFKSSVSTSSGSNVTEKLISMDINEAHQKFGHIHPILLKNTLLHYGYKPTGVFNPCHSCMIYKAQRKSVNKFTDLIVTKPGERLYIDTSGPLPKTLGGNN